MTIPHEHRATRAVLTDYGGPVSFPGNPAARNSVTIIEFCSCRAHRAVNCRGKHRERSGWLEPETDWRGEVIE